MDWLADGGIYHVERREQQAPKGISPTTSSTILTPASPLSLSHRPKNPPLPDSSPRSFRRPPPLPRRRPLVVAAGESPPLRARPLRTQQQDRIGRAGGGGTYLYSVELGEFIPGCGVAKVLDWLRWREGGSFLVNR